MKCPHCIVEINPDFGFSYIGQDVQGHWALYTMKCPNPKCNKLIIELAVGTSPINEVHRGYVGIQGITSRILVNPLTSSRPPVPKDVEDKFASDYKEACLILTFSPKASAALSRRCLQNLLRERAGIKKGDLSNEIQQVLDSHSLPSHLAESIDAVRNIGNFAAHPLKSTSSGEVIEVELGESEWLLDVLESLFDFYFVQPAILKAKKDALNKKLTDVGKPPMK